MNWYKRKKLMLILAAALAWLLLGGSTKPEKIELDPIAAADIYETEDSVILPMDSLRVTEEVSQEAINHTLEYVEKTKKGEMKKREPLTVIAYGDGIYSIIDGNKTCSALKQLGAENVPAIVVDRPYHKDVKTFDDLTAAHTEVESEFHQLVTSLAEEYQASLTEHSILYDAESIHQKAKGEYGGDYSLVVDVFSADLTVSGQDPGTAASDLKDKNYVLCMKHDENENCYTAYIRLSNGTIAQILVR